MGAVEFYLLHSAYDVQEWVISSSQEHPLLSFPSSRLAVMLIALKIYQTSFTNIINTPGLATAGNKM
jgi:hypothetical protein